jgi:tRNA(Ile)-lysidine synthase
MPLLAAEGLTAGRLARLADRIAQADEALEAKAHEVLERAEPCFSGRRFSFQASLLGHEPFEISLRVLEQALGRAGLSLENSRLQRLESCVERLLEALRSGEGIRLTVAGALVHLDRAGRVVIQPEPPRQRGR